MTQPVGSPNFLTHVPKKQATSLFRANPATDVRLVKSLDGMAPRVATVTVVRVLRDTLLAGLIS
jgi:hypothetical protein